VSSCTLVNRFGSEEYGKAITGPGEGAFTFTAYEPLADHPVKVRYVAPAHDVAHAQVVIIIPGTGRDARAYRDDWAGEVKDKNVLLLVPEFSEEEFPGVSSYNLGNMVDEDGHLVPAAQWSFQLVEAIFDYAVHDVGSDARTYALFGHSAGAQFVHRFIEFMPHNRARVAVAANAGWYTMPNDSVPFPYGLKASPSSENRLREALRSNFVVLLGADDIDTSATNLRTDAQANAQGPDRLDRGMAFYRRSRDVAEKHSFLFRWRLMVVPGVAHSHTDMAKVAAPLILGESA
jgi:hypothetical protein